MLATGSFLLVIATCLISIPVAVFALEVFAGLVRGHRNRSAPPSGMARPRVAVLVPAHNEGSGLLPTINDIQAQLRAGDRLVVVADNCRDSTATVAAAAGAEVTERHDPERHGKGYALDWGVRHISADPRDVVVIVDADCRLADGAIDWLVETCVRTHRPTQALYVMTAPTGCLINLQVAEFAWRVRNRLRPAGLRALNLPCQLVGTGMAFPWDVIRNADLRSGQIVEDLKLGLDLAVAGFAPLFCPASVVRSEFPYSPAGADAQRQRWERGHISLIMAEAPRLLWLGLWRGDIAVLALALDLSVPPLALLAVLVTGSLALGGLAALLGASALAGTISAIDLTILSAAVLAAWFACGRDVLPARALLSIAPYIGRKISLYSRALVDRASPQWIRTDRKKPDL